MINIFFLIKKICLRTQGVWFFHLSFYGLYRVFNIIYGSSIAHNTKFSDTPIFPHNISGIFISEKAILGKGCTIYHNVTIGSVEKHGKKLAPTIGDNVVIGAGAIIIGDVKVGSNVKIGAGALVFQDIPDNATVVGQKPRIILKSN
jgi:serine O-acetyltransferase